MLAGMDLTMLRDRAFLARWVPLAAAAGVFVLLVFTPKPWDLRVADAGRMKVDDYVRVGWWWAAALNLIPLVVLGVTAPRWARSRAAERTPFPPASRFFWPVVLGAVVVAGVFSAPRLKHGLWDDEEYSVRRAILGVHVPTKEGGIRFRELSWTHTLWFYLKPTNHILQSVLSRASNAVWRAVKRPQGLQFNEVALRMPGWLVGLSVPVVLALFLRSLGWASAGAVAAWLIAIHPWAQRLISEARGYPYVLCFVALTMLMAVLAARGNRWRDWALFGLSQFALLATWPLGVGFLALLNLGLLARLWGSPLRQDALWRWFVVSTIAAMAVVQLFFPCIPQFQHYISSVAPRSLGPTWVSDVAAYLVSGVPWSKSGPGYIELRPLFNAAPLFTGLVVFAAVACAVIGAFRFLRHREARWLVPAILLTGPLLAIYAEHRKAYFYEWYMAFLLPGIVALVAVGVASVSARRDSRWSRATALLPAALVLALFVATQPIRSHLITHPTQGTRESVERTRSSPNPFDPVNQSVLTASTLSPPEVYDPLVRKVLTREALVEAMKDADARGIPLYLNQGFLVGLRDKFPDVALIVEDKRFFKRVADFPGIESMLDRHVFKYRPRSAELLDRE